VYKNSVLLLQFVNKKGVTGIVAAEKNVSAAAAAAAKLAPPR